MENLINQFELLIRVQSYLRDTEVARHNPNAYGYDLSRFNQEITQGSGKYFFERFEAEQFVNLEIENVRAKILSF